MKADPTHWYRLMKALEVHNQRLIHKKGLYIKASGAQVQAATVIQAKAKAKQLPGVAPQPAPLTTSVAGKRKKARSTGAGFPARILTPLYLHLQPWGSNHQQHQHQQLLQQVGCHQSGMPGQSSTPRWRERVLWEREAPAKRRLPRQHLLLGSPRWTSTSGRICPDPSWGQTTGPTPGPQGTVPRSTSPRG